MMIRILQIATICMFVLIVGAGVIVLFFASDKMDAYGKLIGIIWPLFVAEVIPALIGTPLTEAIRNLTNKEAK